jgi:hypothetical protein
LSVAVCIPSGDEGDDCVEEALVAFPTATGFCSEFQVREVVCDGEVTWGLAAVLEPGEANELWLLPRVTDRSEGLLARRARGGSA